MPTSHHYPHRRHPPLLPSNHAPNRRRALLRTITKRGQNRLNNALPPANLAPSRPKRPKTKHARVRLRNWTHRPKTNVTASRQHVQLRNRRNSRDLNRRVAKLQISPLQSRPMHRPILRKTRAVAETKRLAVTVANRPAVAAAKQLPSRRHRLLHRIALLRRTWCWRLTWTNHCS